MKQTLLYAFLFILLSACGNAVSKPDTSPVVKEMALTDTLFSSRPAFVASCFAFPVGPPKARGYYNAQGFGENYHLGDDWNGLGGGNTDLGDTVCAIGAGYVISARHEGPGWGNVVRIIHKIPGDSLMPWVESVYAHLEVMLADSGNYIPVSRPIGTIGNADGVYWAHLHLEVRDSLFMDIGGGYSDETQGYMDPTAFIKSRLCR